jgi:hypothetical protein
MDLNDRALSSRSLKGITTESETQTSETASLQDVLRALNKAELRYASLCKPGSFTKRLEPLLNFLERYSKAVDVVVQGTLNPVAVAWGVIRILIEVTGIDLLECFSVTHPTSSASMWLC